MIDAAVTRLQQVYVSTDKDPPMKEMAAARDAVLAHYQRYSQKKHSRISWPATSKAFCFSRIIGTGLASTGKAAVHTYSVEFKLGPPVKSEQKLPFKLQTLAELPAVP
jgi:hypothetical protein